MSSRFRKWSLGIIIFLIAIVVLVPQLSDLLLSLDNLISAYWPNIVVAILAWLTTFVFAAGVYTFITPKRLHFRETLLVQVASGFTNRLIPAGAGALATNIKYLMAMGYGKIQAGTIAAINNILGFAASFIVLIVTALFNGLDLISGIRFGVILSDRLLMAVLIITLLVAMYAWATKLPRKLLRLAKKINYQVEASLLNQYRLLASLSLSIAITLSYGLCLYMTALALNVHLGLFQTFLVLIVGVIIGSITPTPGGVGGAEAALVGALNATGVDIHQAVSLALTYRLITYWLPILPGYFALGLARRKGLV